MNESINAATQKGQPQPQPATSKGSILAATNLHMGSMILLELAKGLLLFRNLGGKGILEGGDSADGSSIPLGGEEGLSI